MFLPYQRWSIAQKVFSMSPIRMTGRIVAATFFMFTGVARAADNGAWTVSKSSGDVWTVTAGAQPVSLSQQTDLQPGDTIRTGRNGRVLLVRGEESILIAPNSAIGIPKKSVDGMSTTIVQQAGSILLEVEKRNVQHFEVETPYLAAVVKGTQFRVSVGATGTSVAVLRGQVQVADFKSGQIAEVMPGQSATSFAQGKIGLSLSGSGSFGPIEQGKPRAPAIERLMVPKNGLTAPRNAAAGTQVRMVGQITPGTTMRAVAASPAGSATAARTAVVAKPAVMPVVTAARPAGSIRIAAPIGDVRLNFNKLTNGLARGTTAPTHGRSVASRDTTVWTSRDGNPAAAQGNSSESNNANGSSNAAANSPGVAAAATPVVPVVSIDNGTASGIGSTSSNNSNSGSSSNNGRGNAAGNGGATQVGVDSGRGNSASNGNGKGNNGNGNGNGGNLGNGNGNNGNGNNGNGNGNGRNR
jgi:hypothetical protein